MLHSTPLCSALHNITCCGGLSKPSFHLYFPYINSIDMLYMSSHFLTECFMLLWCCYRKICKFFNFSTYFLCYFLVSFPFLISSFSQRIKQILHIHSIPTPTDACIIVSSSPCCHRSPPSEEVYLFAIFIFYVRTDWRRFFTRRRLQESREKYSDEKKMYREKKGKSESFGLCWDENILWIWVELKLDLLEHEERRYSRLNISSLCWLLAWHLDIDTAGT